MPENQPDNLSEFGASSFVVKNGNGVFVDLAKLESSAQFELFVDRAFSSGYYFAGLDYPAFLGLLSDYTPEMIAAKSSGGENKSGKIRLASEILAFPEERQPLYKAPRITSGKAEYLFESVMIEKVTEEPLFAEGEDGTQEIVGVEKRSVLVKDSLSFDEFVAAMWMSGVHFGIDADAVREIIASGKTGRITIARPVPPQNGHDSELKEETDRLHRDNAPRELSNGKIDLKQFRNRFPQVREGERLLRKSPRVMGIPGMDIRGNPIEAPIPQDFNLEDLAGEGTRIDRTADCECIVANLDGFLNIDTTTNRIAVMEKIVNYTGVSMRTTGDISLDGENFEEHGEVQENRMLEGKNITLLADVFGKVVSTGGKILLKQNLVAGSATNHDGDIVVEGLASNALLYAKYGKISVKRAENSMIIGKHVALESAANCTIVAEIVEVETSEGCAVAGKNIRIATAVPRKENQTIVSVLVPDFSAFKNRISAIDKRIEEIALEIEALREKSKAFTEQPELRNYLIISGKLQRKEITLNEEQKANLHKLGVKISPSLKAVSSINAKIHATQDEQKELEEERTAVEQSEKEIGDGISCSIASISRDTLVWKRQAEVDALQDAPQKELAIKLRSPGRPEDKLKPEGGKLNWQYSAA